MRLQAILRSTITILFNAGRWCVILLFFLLNNVSFTLNKLLRLIGFIALLAYILNIFIVAQKRSLWRSNSFIPLANHSTATPLPYTNLRPCSLIIISLIISFACVLVIIFKRIVIFLQSIFSI